MSDNAPTRTTALKKRSSAADGTGAGTARNLMYRRPQRTLLLGIGVASAVLAGVLIAFAIAAGLIELRSPQSDPPSPFSATVRILEEPGPAGRAPVRRTHGAAPPAALAPTARSFDRARESVAVAPVDRTSPRPAPPALPPTPAPPALSPPPVAPPQPAVSPPAAPPAPPAPPATTRPASVLEPVGAGVDKTTDRIATTLRTLTRDVGAALVPVSPQVGALLAQTGGALGDVVAATGDVVGRVLGHRSAQ
jgi:hypothetical protein